MADASDNFDDDDSIMLDPTAHHPISGEDSIYPITEGDIITDGQPKVYRYATEADPLSITEELSLELFLLTKNLGVSRDGHDMLSKFINKAMQIATTQCKYSQKWKVGV
jgi:hypothetical protein